MAIALGTNDLKIYRRHASYCNRYPGLKNKPDTYRPTKKKDQKADTCECPIWCRGYLAKETKIAKGKLRAYSGARRTAFRGEAEQDSGLIPNSIPGARRTWIPG